MPANLTPQYHRAEESYRRAQSADERVKCLEEMLREIPKHKGTEKLQADLKSRLKDEREDAAAEKKSAKPSGKSWRFPRQGAGTVVVIGAPNSGKSRLVRDLTGVPLEVAEYPYTTREPAPAMMKFEDVTVQLLDTPPPTGGRLEPQLVNLVRTADLVALCLSGADDDGPDATAELLRLLDARKTALGGRRGFREDDYTTVDVRTLLVVTNGCAAGVPDRLEYWNAVAPRALETEVVDLDRTEDVERLRARLFRMLDVMRVYTKTPGKKVEMTAPFTLPVGSAVEELAFKIHQDLAAKLKFAKVWKPNIADPRTVGPAQQLEEGDVVELHTG
jgi:hypothetical protein